LVFPMEEYREQLTAYHEQWAPYWRPHMVQMIRDVLSRPLADLPITYPLGWGMPAPFPETPGQVLNAWLELIPAGLFTSSYCAAQLGRQTTPGQLGGPGRTGASCTSSASITRTSSASRTWRC
jgi:methionyl-tRNA synthetase